MRQRLLAALLAGTIFGLLAAPVVAFSQWGFVLPKPAAAAGYTGPGDIVASATAWWGLRAYTSTLANAGASTTKVIDVLGATTGTVCTIFLKGDGTGNLDLTTAGAGGAGNQCLLGATTFCTSTNPSCSVNAIYDQTGNGNKLSGPGTGNPSLTFNCLASFPCMGFSSVLYFQTGTLGAGITAPSSFSAVALQSSYTTYSGVISQYTGGNQNTMGWDSATTASIFSGSHVHGTAAASQWHAFNAVSGASAVMNIDGTETTGNSGAGASSTSIEVGSATQASNHLVGEIMEAGVWGGVSFSSGNRSSLCHNQYAYWGTVTSC